MCQIQVKPEAGWCLGLGFGLGFNIFVRLVLNLKQSSFQSVLKIKVFFHAKEKTTD